MEKLLPLSLITTKGGIESLISLCSTLIEGQKKRAQSRFREYLGRGLVGVDAISGEKSHTRVQGCVCVYFFIFFQINKSFIWDGWAVVRGCDMKPKLSTSSSEFRAGGRSDVEIVPIGAPWSCGLMQVLGNKARRPERLEFVARAWGTSFSYSKPSHQDKSLVLDSARGSRTFSIVAVPEVISQQQGSTLKFYSYQH